MEHTARFLPNRPIGIRQENPLAQSAKQSSKKSHKTQRFGLKR